MRGKSKLCLDADVLHAELMAWKATGTPSRLLLEMFAMLVSSLMGKASYFLYPAFVKDDMRSEATYQFLKYSHNYKPERSKSRNPAFTFLAWNAECAFRKVLSSYYRNKNTMDTLQTCTGFVADHAEYVARLTRQRDSDEIGEDMFEGCYLISTHDTETEIIPQGVAGRPSASKERKARAVRGGRDRAKDWRAQGV